GPMLTRCTLAYGTRASHDKNKITMRHTRVLLVSAVLWASVMPASALAQNEREIVGDGQGHEEIVVDFDDGASEGQMRADARLAGVTLVPNSFMARDDHIMHGLVPAGQAEAIAARMRRMPGVEAADANFVLHADFVPNDPQWSDQWGMTRVGAP